MANDAPSFAVAGEWGTKGGIVAKSARGRCQSDGRSTSWLKIKNEDYSRDGAALNGRRLYWGGNSQTVPLLNSPALGQKKEFKCSLKLR